MGRLRFKFWPRILSCVTQATFLKSVILSFLICKMGMMTSIPIRLLKGSNEHSLYILHVVGSQYIIKKQKEMQKGKTVLKIWGKTKTRTKEKAVSLGVFWVQGAPQSPSWAGSESEMDL